MMMKMLLLCASNGARAVTRSTIYQKQNHQTPTTVDRKFLHNAILRAIVHPWNLTTLQQRHGNDVSVPIEPNDPIIRTDHSNYHITKK